jgi:predicted transcriptional regulator
MNKVRFIQNWQSIQNWQRQANEMISRHCTSKTVVIINNRALGESMRRMRGDLGVSVRCLSRRMGVSASYLSDLELGRRNWSEILVERYLFQLDSEDEPTKEKK